MKLKRTKKERNEQKEHQALYAKPMFQAVEMLVLI